MFDISSAKQKGAPFLFFSLLFFPDGNKQFQNLLAELAECADRFLSEASKYGEVSLSCHVSFVEDRLLAATCSNPILLLGWLGISVVHSSSSAGIAVSCRNIF